MSTNYPKWFLALALFLSAACQAEPDQALSEILKKIDTETSVRNLNRKALDVKTDQAYMAKYGHEIDAVFDSEAINIFIHLKSRLSDIECSDLALNDVETLHILFKKFTYLDSLCLSEFDIENDMDFLISDIGDPSLVSILERYESKKVIQPDSEKELYDLAFIYCAEELLNFLKQRGVTEGILFNQTDFELRESSELYSCI